MNESRVNWSPERNEEFGREFDEEKAEEYEPEKIRQVISKWGELVSQINPEELQDELSRYFLNTLEWYGNQDESLAKNNLSEIYKFYNTFFSDMKDHFHGSNERSQSWNFDLFQLGFMTEYAVAKALAVGEHNVWYPSERDNKVLKVDWWVCPKGEDETSDHYWGVQVKNIGFRNKPSNEPIIVDPRNNLEMVNAVTKYMRTMEQSLRFSRNNSMMVERLKPFVNIDPMCILATSPSFDSATGKPTDTFIEVLNKKIDNNNLKGQQ